MKRLFVYSAVTLFDTTNTSIDTHDLGGAGSGVFGLVSFACEGPRFESLCVSLLLSGRDPVYGSIECYKVALIRDPGLDREQTSKNVSPTI
jgi:hypothetical protein